LHREERDASRGSPRSLAAQKTLARDDNQTEPLPLCATLSEFHTRWGIISWLKNRSEFEMTLPGNSNVGRLANYSWRAVLVVLAICALTVNVATRYSASGSEAPTVRTVCTVKFQSQDCQRQRLLDNGLHWISPVPSSTFVRPRRASVRAVTAVFHAIHLDSECWLYNRPPPSC